MGIGVGPNLLSASNGSQISGQSNALNLDRSNSSPANTLLADVMKRPEFLPKRVLAKKKNHIASQLCSEVGLQVVSNAFYYSDTGASLSIDALDTSSVVTINGYSFTYAFDNAWGFNGNLSTVLIGGQLYQLDVGDVSCLVTANRV